MLKELQKRIKGKSDALYRKHKGMIFDILIYGSAVKGKAVPRDIDIAIVFTKAGKKEYFDIPYELKTMLDEIKIDTDVKGIRIEELFDPNLLSRENMLIEGYSLVHGRFLHEMLGFSSYSLFTYSLSKMSNSQKTRFQYSLKGRRGEEGMVQKTRSRHIGKGCMLVPTKSSEEFKKYLDAWSIEFGEIKGLFYGYVK